jgi:ureidoglycolate lyase
MRKVRIRELGLESFRPYGSYANMIDPDAPKIGKEPVEFFRDMLPLDLGGASVASFSICRVLERPLLIDATEYHNRCAEGILPIDSDVLIHVGPATPPPDPIPLDRFEVFRIPRGTLVSLRAGVWHHAPFAWKSRVANVLIVLPERTYAIDCMAISLSSGDRIEILA